MKVEIDARGAIRTAFTKLRAKGWTARMNFWCCQGCGWAALGDKCTEQSNVVFFHQQDNEDLVKKNACYLAWQGDGEALVAALRETGLSVTWDRTTNTRIFVSGEVETPDVAPDRELCEVL